MISRAGRPLAKLVPFDTPVRRRFGIDKGVFEVPDDFDAPLPDDVSESFES